jgi:hypothetical protein
MGTAIIKLAGVGLLDLLPQLYGAIWIPEAVRDEYLVRADVLRCWRTCWLRLNGKRSHRRRASTGQRPKLNWRVRRLQVSYRIELHVLSFWASERLNSSQGQVSWEAPPCHLPFQASGRPNSPFSPWLTRSWRLKSKVSGIRTPKLPLLPLVDAKLAVEIEGFRHQDAQTPPSPPG